MEQVPSLPVRSGQEVIERREMTGATLQSVGQLLATSGAGAVDWVWPQGGSSASRQAFVSVGNGFPPINKRLVERIQALEFIDMADLRPAQWQEVLEPEPDPRQFVILPGLEVARAKRKAVEDIRSWSMCFTIYTAAVGKKYPEMMPEMLAYMLHILRAHREFEEPAWREYDVRFRQQAAVSGNRAWSQLDPQIYSTCFVSRARRPVVPPVPEGVELVKKPARVEQGAGGGKIKTDVCFRFNKNGCPYDQCRFRHRCSVCGGQHPCSQCPKNTLKK